MSREPFTPQDDPADPFAHDPSVESVLTPLWREARWPIEWLGLRSSPVFFGYGVPHGAGEPVLLIPGFMSGDGFMLELHQWLQRIGYRSYLSNIVWNNDCPDRTSRSLARKLEAIQRRHATRVRLVGHSLGGMLAKSLLQDHPQLIDRVVTLGSPFRSLVKAHPAVVGIWEQLKIMRGKLIGRNLKPSCGTGHCLCDFVRNMVRPEPRDVPQYAIYSRVDGVADWQSCREDLDSANTEVNCTHLGMPLHPEVYRAIAARLAEVQPSPALRKQTDELSADPPSV